MSQPPVLKKAVYDTGVELQSALSDRRPSFTALRLLEQGKVLVVLGPQVLSEYENVLNRPAVRQKNPLLTPEHVRSLLDRIETRAEPVTVIRACLQYATPKGPFILLGQQSPDRSDFRYLSVPAQYLTQHLPELHIRTGQRISLFLSAELDTLFVDQRGTGQMPFRQFLQPRTATAE